MKNNSVENLPLGKILNMLTIVTLAKSFFNKKHNCYYYPALL